VEKRAFAFPQFVFPNSASRSILRPNSKAAKNNNKVNAAELVKNEKFYF
jgi:hypothetical protein